MSGEAQSAAPDQNDLPTTSTSTSTATTTNPPSETAIFSSLHSYPFLEDQAFLAGLSQIFGHPGTPVAAEELSQKPDLVLSAKCFYFSRKFQIPTPVDLTAYKAWIASSSSISQVNGEVPVQSNSELGTTPTSSDHANMATNSAQLDLLPTPELGQTATTSSNQAQSQPPQPPYPTSFAAIVDLITNNKPIPGIEEVPTTVLDHGSSKQDKAIRRRKPWEKPENIEADSGTGQEPNVIISASEEQDTKSRDTNGREEGLLRLLKPDAVPDSGLVAKE